MDDRTRAESLARQFLHGDLSRRDFLRRSGGIGAGVFAATSLGSLAMAVANSPAAMAQSPAAGTNPSIVPGGILKAALTGEPDTLDPATSTIYTGAQVYDNIFSKLIDLDENNEFYGVLATKWQQTSPTTWVFDLADGVTFHNGEPFWSVDVKFFL